jgi:hypothetical protein
MVLTPGGKKSVMAGMEEARLETDLPAFNEAEIVGNALAHFSLIIWSDFINVSFIIFAESLFEHTSRITCSRLSPSENAWKERPNMKMALKKTSDADFFTISIPRVIIPVPELA